VYLDTIKAMAEPGYFKNQSEKWSFYRDNFGIKYLGKEDKMEQFDTNLSDLDTVIRSQFELACATSDGIPSVRVLGTSPKGFNSTGESENVFYRHILKTIIEKGSTKLVNKHHELLIKSHICPKFKIPYFKTSVVWRPFDEMTAKEKTEVYKNKVDTSAVLINAGVIDASEERNRLINDPDSGFDGLLQSDSLVDVNAT
jgi:hypothetical protein